MNCPESLKYYSLDEVAECIKGITKETYIELWKLLEQGENPKPLGGDGSNNTTEEPIISSGEYSSDLAAGWNYLSKIAQHNIIEASKSL